MGNTMSKFMNATEKLSLAALAMLLIGLPAATLGFLAHSF